MALSRWSDGAHLHLAASLAAGLVSTTACNPVDVVKTHMFVGGSRFSGPGACLRSILRSEGPRGLMKGWTANYARLGPQVGLGAARGGAAGIAGFRALGCVIFTLTCCKSSAGWSNPFHPQWIYRRSRSWH